MSGPFAVARLALIDSNAKPRVALQEFADYLCESGFVLLSPLKFLFQLRITGDPVDLRFAAAAIDLEIAQQ